MRTRQPRQPGAPPVKPPRGPWCGAAKTHKSECGAKQLSFPPFPKPGVRFPVRPAGLDGCLARNSLSKKIRSRLARLSMTIKRLGNRGLFAPVAARAVSPPAPSRRRRPAGAARRIDSSAVYPCSDYQYGDQRRPDAREQAPRQSSEARRIKMQGTGVENVTPSADRARTGPTSRRPGA